MKKAKNALSLVLALIMAFSVLTIAGINAGAYDTDSQDRFLLPAGSFKSQAALIAIGETAYGSITGSGTRFYKFYNESVRDIELTVSGNRRVFATVSTENGSMFTIEEEKRNSYTAEVSANNNTPIILKGAPVGYYIVEVTSTITSEAATEYSVHAWCAGLPDLLVNINYKTQTMVSGDQILLKLSNLSIENVNYFWQVEDNKLTPDIDESKVVTVSQDGVVSVACPSSELPFTSDLTVPVRAVFYYTKNRTMVEAATKTCTITAQPPNIYLTPYVTELKMGWDDFRTIKAETNMKTGTLFWQSTDPSIVSVNNQGVIRSSNQDGTVTVTVGLRYNGEVLRVRREIVVTVDHTIPVPVKVSCKETISCRPGGFDRNLKCTVTYNNGDVEKASKENIIFTSSNPNVAKVSQRGVVTAVAQGEAVITAVSTVNGSIRATCTVTVGKPLESWEVLLIAPIKVVISLYNIIVDLIGK